MKKFISGFIVGTIICSMIGVFAVSFVANPVDFKVFVNGKEFVSNPPALEVEGRTYLPLRAMGEALGVPVNWNEELRQAEVGNAKVSQDENTVNGYTFSQIQVDNITEGVTSVKADITNNTGKTVSGASFTISFYDANGQRIGSATGVIANKFKNGETKTVQFVSTDTFKAYVTTKFQVDLEY